MSNLKTSEKEVFFEEIIEYLIPKMELKIDAKKLEEATQTAQGLQVFAAAQDFFEKSEKCREAESALEASRDRFSELCKGMFGERYFNCKLRWLKGYSEKDFQEFHKLLSQKVYCMQSPETLRKYCLQDVKNLINRELTLFTKPRQLGFQECLTQLKETIWAKIENNEKFMENAEPGTED